MTHYYQLHMLKEIHARGVIHGDIKPDNILLNWHPNKPLVASPYSLYLIDFECSSIAKQSPALSERMQNRVSCTPTFASVRVLRGHGASQG